MCFLVLFAYAKTVVADGEEDGRTVVAGRHIDVELRGRVFYGVVNQVVNHICDVQLVAQDGGRCRFEVALQKSSAIRNLKLEVCGNVLDQGVEVDLFDVHLKVLARHLRSLQYRFDQHTHTAVFVADDADIGFVGFGVGADVGVLQHLAGQSYCCDWRFDFVGHIVDEVVFSSRRVSPCGKRRA